VFECIVLAHTNTAQTANVIFGPSDAHENAAVHKVELLNPIHIGHNRRFNDPAASIGEVKVRHLPQFAAAS
jgi:hypothetical protein